MNGGLPKLSVNRPITVLMTTIAIVVFGYLAMSRLPVDLLPDLSYPTLTVQTLYPDAAPISVEQYVSRPVEEAVGVIPGVREMRSTSRPGVSEVVLEFGWGEEMDFAALDVREKLGQATLPDEVEPPRVLRYDPSLDPIVRLALRGDRDFDDLRQLADRWLRPRLEAIEGVAAVNLRGGLTPEIVVEVDEDKLGALSLTLDDVSTALQAENINQPGGTLKDFNAIYLVRTLHEFHSLDQVKRTTIREGESGRIRVEDIATVRRGHRDQEEISRLGGEEIIALDLYRAGSANTLEVAEAIDETLGDLNGQLPSDLSLTVLTDQSRYIADAVGQVWSAAAIGGILAVLVLFFFLRDPVSTGIIALTIPVSVIATFLPLRQAGVSLNIMSLGGLALGVGMLVDNSIVVLEAIDRRRAQGRNRREAAILGASEVAGAVTAATLTTICVFAPIIFVEGIAGQLFYDQAVTVCLSLLVSLIVSLTLIPSLAAYDPAPSRSFETLFKWDDSRSPADTPRPWTLTLGPFELPPVGDGRHWFSKVLTVLLFPIRLVITLVLAIIGGLGWAFSWAFHVLGWPVARAFDALGNAYPGALRRALRGRWAVLLVAVALFTASVAAIPHLGMNLVPDLSQGAFAFQLRLPEGTPLRSTAETVARLEKPLLGDARFDKVFSTIGSLPQAASGRSTVGENLAQMDFTLPEGASVDEEAKAIERVRSVLALVPQAQAELVRPSVLTMDAPISVRVFGDDLKDIDAAAHAIQGAIAQLPGVADAATSSEAGSPEVTITVHREMAQALGATGEQIGRALRGKIRGELVGRYREGEERLDIRLRSAQPFRDQAAKIRALRIRLPGGEVVPVSAVADVRVDRGPAAIHRAGGSRVAEVNAQLAGTDLATVIDDVRRAVSALPLPSDVKVEMAGQNSELELSMGSLRLALALAIFLVYAVMAAQFESLLHPFVILMAVPLGLVGIVGALGLTGTAISVLALIGAVMLAGIVVNNAIVLVDAIGRRLREGQAVDEAIVDAGRERFRPILMTTTTTVLALLPMGLGLGAGDELRAPLAITVIGGLTLGTVLTLIVIPCLFKVMERRRSDVQSIQADGD